MNYQQKIKKVGNSWGLVLPKELRETLGFGENTVVNLTPSADAKSLIVSTGNTVIDPDFYTLLNEVSDEYQQALQELA